MRKCSPKGVQTIAVMVSEVRLDLFVLQSQSTFDPQSEEAPPVWGKQRHLSPGITDKLLA